MWGSSGTDVFAVGTKVGEYTANDRGLILHYDGVSWSQLPDITEKFLRSVWGSSSTDVFVVGGLPWNGGQGIILHYNGTDWSVKDTDKELFAVWGSSGSDVYAVGRHGTILHYNGTSWSAIDSGTNDDLMGIWGNSSGDIYAVGSQNGSILHYGAGSRYSVTEGLNKSFMYMYPSAISKAGCLTQPLRIFTFVGAKGSSFTGSEDVVWEYTDAIKTLWKLRIGKRVMIALVQIDADNLETGTHTAFIGNSIGYYTVKP
jgi:hypothetical protein